MAICCELESHLRFQIVKYLKYSNLDYNEIGAGWFIVLREKEGILKILFIIYLIVNKRAN